jgi:two-component system, NarL family, response regulator DegU
MDKIKVMIADDHSMVRQGLKQILELEEDIVVTAQACDGIEALKYAEMYRPDVILMDINMPEMNGLQAIKELKELDKNYKVIVLTIHEDREYMFKTLQMGAEGYILKDSEPSLLINAIRTVHKGEAFIQPNMTKELVREYNRITVYGKNGMDHNNLTAREVLSAKQFDSESARYVVINN